jgi:hypothetical protein
MRTRIPWIATLALVVSCAWTSTALAQGTPKKCYAKPKGPTGVLRDKPASDGAETAQVFYGQRLLYTEVKQDENKVKWLNVKDPYQPKVAGWLMQSEAHPRRPEPLQTGSLRERSSGVTGKSTDTTSTLAVRGLGPRARALGEDRGKEDPERMNEVLQDIDGLQNTVTGEKGMFPDKATREKKAKEFLGGES